MSMSTVLITDDEKQIRDVLSAGCSEWGYNVCTASNGKEALDISQTTFINLFIMDNSMPELNGVDTFLRLRQTDKYKNTPVLFVTGETDVLNRIGPVECVGYIHKPFVLNDIKKALVCLTKRKDSMQQKKTCRFCQEPVTGLVPICAECLKKHPEQVMCQSCEKEVPVTEVRLYMSKYFCPECSLTKALNTMVICQHCSEPVLLKATAQAEGKLVCRKCLEGILKP